MSDIYTEREPWQHTLPEFFCPYGASAPYSEALHRLASVSGLVVVEDAADCLQRLAEPQHDCNNDRHYYNCMWRWDNKLVPPSWLFDHPIWLRTPGTTRWVLLLQPYPNGDASEPLKAFVGSLTAVPGSAMTWESIGPAPYGHGTEGYLIYGISDVNGSLFGEPNDPPRWSSQEVDR